MVSIKRTFFGIDPSGGPFPFTFAAIDENRQLLALTSAEGEDLFTLFNDYQSIIVAINAPRQPNKGLVRKKIEAEQMRPGQLRKVDMRLAELELNKLGISIAHTASRPENCAAWMQLGFKFHNGLENWGFKPLNTEYETHQYLETNPHAAFCTLLGHLPLPKPTLEGRLQRQLILYEQDLGINDPMEFFEEITRHRLINGALPREIIYFPEELDALVAAFTAYMAFTQPESVICIGDLEEGQIVLPVCDLKEVYS